MIIIGKSKRRLLGSNFNRHPVAGIETVSNAVIIDSKYQAKISSEFEIDLFVTINHYCPFFSDCG